jgi:small-conductance mechanosensitive channel
MELLLNKLLEQSTYWLPKITLSIFILIGFIFLSKIFKKSIHKYSKNINLDKHISKLLSKIISGIILFFGIITSLGTLGVDVSAIVAGLGLTGFAFGFALKDTISNILSGAMLLFYKPFKIGDNIIIAKYEGIVVAIDLRYTELKNGDDIYLIPNKKLFSDPITIINS